MAGVDDHRLGKPFDHLVRGEVGGAVGIFQNLIVPVGVQLREHAGALVPVGEDGLVVVQGGVIQKLHTQGEIVGGSRPQRMAAERQALEEIAGLDEHGGRVQGQ